ncbi:MAG: ATP:cob(I)alamin adenosyltransferase [Planctomycetes bacterium GWF2_41_51]|nr:MAG: ATP:cob(I)alamin adenosyltransferase [Planctomycetes bacterium GWF2_41_51]HBG27948.1 cob(I)yrinic acid a,c-diamide adenosyltransferase [Phycisphaerales bacterium]
MSVTTKKGDAGQTDLLFGERIDKDDIRIEIFGCLDECSSHIGMARSQLKEKRVNDFLEAVQRELFVIGAEIATFESNFGQLKKRIDESYVKRIEELIIEFEKEKNYEECCFYLPGENLCSTTLDVARTVTRRLERRLVTFKKRHLLTNNHIIPYANRLSDLLFILSRRYETQSIKV